jgi:hypothetical protein
MSQCKTSECINVLGLNLCVADEDRSKLSWYQITTGPFARCIPQPRLISIVSIRPSLKQLPTVPAQNTCPRCPHKSAAHRARTKHLPTEPVQNTCPRSPNKTHPQTQCRLFQFPEPQNYRPSSIYTLGIAEWSDRLWRNVTYGTQCKWL